MEPFQTIAILVTAAGVFACVNYHFLRLPMTIGLMLLSLVTSVGLMILAWLGLPVADFARTLVAGIGFPQLLLQGMLGLLLFAGALFVNLDDLYENKLEIGILATLGVLTSTFLVGSAVYALGQVMGFGLRWIDCLLFGALISPTDPIAVLSIMKKAGAPKSLETKIAGESLFNDGFGVVVFLVLLELAAGPGHEVSAGHVAFLFVEEVAGGVVFGLVAGYAAYRILATVNHYQVEIMITLALVVGGYALATAWHLSGPIAMVVAGLLVGNHGRRLAMSPVTREHIDTFWELVDEILNALLFVLIGLEALVLSLEGRYLVAGALAICVALAARLVSVGTPVSLLRRYRPFAPHAIRIMTWGGLRGGISVALALSLPDQCPRDLFLTMTYCVVAFSILVQGLTIRRLVKNSRA